MLRVSLRVAAYSSSIHKRSNILRMVDYFTLAENMAVTFYSFLFCLLFFFLYYSVIIGLNASLIVSCQKKKHVPHSVIQLVHQRRRAYYPYPTFRPIQFFSPLSRDVFHSLLYIVVIPLYNCLGQFYFSSNRPILLFFLREKTCLLSIVFFFCILFC